MVPESHINAGASGILAYPDTTSPQSPAIHSWAPATDSMFWKMEDSVEMEMEDRDGMCSPQDDNEYMEHARPRKRTRRACDKCSSSRTRCDGER